MIAYPPVEWQQEAARLDTALEALKHQAHTLAAERAHAGQKRRDAIEAELRSLGPTMQDIIEQMRELGVEVQP